MNDIDPFSKELIENTYEEILKNLEPRWGLTLLSFLPPNAQKKFLDIQEKISTIKTEHKNNSRCYICFYYPQQFHITHLTLLRSDCSQPVHYIKLTQDRKNLFNLFTIIYGVTLKIKPIKVLFDRLTIGYNGIELIMMGECSGEESINYRCVFLEELNQNLSIKFNLSRREWDTDPLKYSKLHSSLGFIKRKPPQGYKLFIDEIKKITISPFTFYIDKIVIIHHTYRTLLVPHEGMFEFPLGEKIKTNESKFINSLNVI